MTTIYTQRPGTNPPAIDAILIAVVGGLLALGSLAVLILNLLKSDGQGIVAAIVCLGSGVLGGGMLAVIGIGMIRRETALIDFHLTPTALERRRNERLAETRPYAAFTAVRMILSQRIIRRGRPQLYLYPAIILEGGFDAVELGISYGDFVAEHDVRALVQDLLPRLPASAAVEPTVRTFADTGVIPNLATLPEK